MSERKTGATPDQIAAALDCYCSFSEFRAASKHFYERDADEWAEMLVDVDHRIVYVEDLRTIIGGLNTAELESGDCPELNQASGRVWNLIMGES